MARYVPKMYQKLISCWGLGAAECVTGQVFANVSKHATGVHSFARDTARSDRPSTLCCAYIPAATLRIAAASQQAGRAVLNEKPTPTQTAICCDSEAQLQQMDARNVLMQMTTTNVKMIYAGARNNRTALCTHGLCRHNERCAERL